jgi:DNA polymerase-3 subunit delta'
MDKMDNSTMNTMNMVFNPQTLRAINDYIDRPSHALILTGPSGSGKASTVRHIVSKILCIPSDQPDKYLTYPYLRTIRPVDSKAIPIETIRELQGFLSLHIPGAVAGSIARVAVIEDSQLLTTEAQNALLKTLEEPPADTILVLTASSTQSLLPTIQSRVRQLLILPPSLDELASHFAGLGYSSENIQKALQLSGELPGLAAALLTEDQSHPLVIAVVHARGILQSKVYERLLLVDGLSKQKQLCLDILYVLGRMSRMALLRTTDPKASKRWQHIMRSTYSATEQFEHNAQPKLILTNLMLEL